MEIVDLNADQRYDDDPSERAGLRWIERTDGGPVRFIRRTGPAQRSAVLLSVGFLLVLASQWYPWVRVTGVSKEFDGVMPLRNGDMINSYGILPIPYYLLWLMVFMSAGSLLFAAGRRRRALFGAAVGALATQLLIVIPVLHRPAVLVYDSRIPNLRVVHTAGSYFVIAAFAVIATALVTAVSGKVLPSRFEDAGAAPDRVLAGPDAAPAGPSGSATESVVDTGDDVTTWTPIEPETMAVPGPTDQVAPVHDHSIYMRPVSVDDADDADQADARPALAGRPPTDRAGTDRAGIDRTSASPASQL